MTHNAASRFTILSALGAALALGGCALFAPPVEAPAPATPSGAIEVRTARAVPASPNDGFTLVSAHHLPGAQGGTIVAEVEFGGGCREHDFFAWWDGTVRESYPPQVTIALRHDGHGDMCRALLRREVAIDLAALPAPAPEYVVTLAGPGGAVPVTVRSSP